jgi:hypothetical protein
VTTKTGRNVPPPCDGRRPPGVCLRAGDREDGDVSFVLRERGDRGTARVKHSR